MSVKIARQVMVSVRDMTCQLAEPPGRVSKRPYDTETGFTKGTEAADE